VRALDAVTENGLLHVDLVREVPEALKPRQIRIATKNGAAIEGKADAPVA
jgi:molecular chaperone IbpA